MAPVHLECSQLVYHLRYLSASRGCYACCSTENRHVCLACTMLLRVHLTEPLPTLAHLAASCLRNSHVESNASGGLQVLLRRCSVRRSPSYSVENVSKRYLLFALPQQKERSIGVSCDDPWTVHRSHSTVPWLPNYRAGNVSQGHVLL